MKGYPIPPQWQSCCRGRANKSCHLLLQRQDFFLLSALSAEGKKLSLRSLPFDRAQGRELVERRLCGEYVSQTLMNMPVSRLQGVATFA
jgi:hypothetical protein